MKKLNLTSKEALVLRTFLPKQNVNDFGEGVYTKMNFLTMDIFKNESKLLLPNECKGILGSLAKKGLIYVDYESKEQFGKKDEMETPNQFIYLGSMFEDNQQLLNEIITKANETK
jgi:hypothetical protein